MATNYVQDGEVLDLTAPYAVSSGDGLLVGSIFGVAQADAENAASVSAVRRGVFTLTKTAGEAWTQGAKIYWDNTAKSCTTTASTSAGDNTLIGAAASAAGSAATTGDVALDGAVR